MIFSRIILRLWRLTKPIFGKHKLTSPWNVNLFWRLTKPIFWQAQVEMWTYFLFSQIPLLECISQGQTKWLKEGKPFKLQPRHFQSSYQTPAQPINQGQASIRQKPNVSAEIRLKKDIANLKFWRKKGFLQKVNIWIVFLEIVYLAEGSIWLYRRRYQISQNWRGIKHFPFLSKVADQTLSSLINILWEGTTMQEGASQKSEKGKK